MSGMASLLGKEDKTKENFVVLATELSHYLSDKVLSITVPPTQENLDGKIKFV